MSCAKLLLLNHPTHIAAGISLAHRLRAVADHDSHPSWVRKFRYIKDMEKKRFAADFM
jgi:hypothetical protein